MSSTKPKLFCSIAASVKFYKTTFRDFSVTYYIKAGPIPPLKITHKILHINKYSTGIIYKLLWLKMLNCQEV